MNKKFMGICLLLCLGASLGFSKPKGYPLSPLWKKLNSIIIDKVEFEDEKPIAIFKLLRIRSKELDPTGKGVNFVFKGLNEHKSLVTLKLSNIPLAEVIKYVCLSGNLMYKVDTYAVVIMPKVLKKKKKINGKN
jgi:hypothetical protein